MNNLRTSSPSKTLDDTDYNTLMESINADPQFYRLATERYSCRKYSSRPVDREMVLAVLDAARLAPSACNKQPWVFTVADKNLNPELHAAVAASYGREWAEEAPVLIVVSGIHSQAWHRADGKDHTDVDIAITTEHLCLAAASLGLGTCWICNFDRERLSQALNCPDDVEPVVIIPLGYPADDSVRSPRPRKSLDEIVRWEKF